MKSKIVRRSLGGGYSACRFQFNVRIEERSPVGLLRKWLRKRRRIEYISFLHNESCVGSDFTQDQLANWLGILGLTCDHFISIEEQLAFLGKKGDSFSIFRDGFAREQSPPNMFRLYAFGSGLGRSFRPLPVVTQLSELNEVTTNCTPPEQREDCYVPGSLIGFYTDL